MIDCKGKVRDNFWECGIHQTFLVTIIFCFSATKRNMKGKGLVDRVSNAALPSSNHSYKAPSAIKKFLVDHENHNSNLDSFLSNQLGISKSSARLKVLNMEVFIAGSMHARSIKRITPSSTLHAGDSVHVAVNASARKELDVAEKESLFTKTLALLKENIVYKDQHILILNKPRDFSVQGMSIFNIFIKYSNDVVKMGQKLSETSQTI
jgi:hypothetical protein